jgi:hypothetical protein
MTANAWHLAELNVARALSPLDSPRLADFVAGLDTVNRLAECSPGFIWRLKSDSGNATDIRVDDDPQYLVNLSVWASVEALFDFVYKSAHTGVMARRREWFEKPTAAHQVLWWLPAGQLPTTGEALARLQLLRELGATPEAFTFKQRFPPPGVAGSSEDMKPEPYCAGWA